MNEFHVRRTLREVNPELSTDCVTGLLERAWATTPSEAAAEPEPEAPPATAKKGAVPPLAMKKEKSVDSPRPSPRPEGTMAAASDQDVSAFLADYIQHELAAEVQHQREAKLAADCSSIGAVAAATALAAVLKQLPEAERAAALSVLKA
eukprot:NODE_8119_length_564_cov_25.652174_g8096_i0.p1 GENE.NODE_8119_length_564_cov_25.652174_g8096_i0~~NODE_8119_length_564_cov_25.652174_g8096_i0.p1  ORF type:complete len:170 (-),score=50.26 NODE_8119_length_564_cov_25.652174_g8096_i0:53-499(-)